MAGWKVVVVLAVLASVFPSAKAEMVEDVPDRFAPGEGLDNIPPGCLPFSFLSSDEPLNPCHAIATGMNGLDSPKVDVLLMVPASPTAERDIRIMRQSVQMWEHGLQWMAADLGLGWLAEGLEFRISTQVVDEAVQGPFTEYAILDPEIVVIAANPTGGLGIGFDPQYLASEITGNEDVREGPCHGLQAPFLLDAWRARPGFDAHHGDEGGTYVEDCDGAGGNICFSVNAAVDPDTQVADVFQLYDLVSHETGHCLTLGHVGDGAEGSWAAVPANDIMAYSQQPMARSKCVSSLDLEGFALTMSKYLDANGDGGVDEGDRMWANDAEGEVDGRPFQIQHPGNHYYASPTREARDCPQPDMSLAPFAELLNFTPEAPPRAVLGIEARWDGEAVAQGFVNFQGRALGDIPAAIAARPLPVPALVLEDPAGDAALPHYDILSVEANVTDEALQVVVTYGDLRPDNGQAPAPQYSLQVNEGTFYSWADSEYVAFEPGARTITFTLPRQKMAEGINDNLGGHYVIEAPYEVRTWVYLAPAHGDANFDYAPELEADPLVLGPVTSLADAAYVRLSVPGQNVTVPIDADGAWSGNVDLAPFEPGQQVNVSASWLSPAGFAIDSDRVLVVPDPSVPVDEAAVHGASAGPGSGGEGENPTPGAGMLLVLTALFILAVALRRS